VMERPSDTPPMWCNPQTLHRDSDDQATALESEVCVCEHTVEFNCCIVALSAITVVEG
jgi:hypothetical protein